MNITEKLLIYKLCLFLDSVLIQCLDKKFKKY